MKNTLAFQGFTCFSVRLEVARCDKSSDLNVLVLESDHNPGYYSIHNFPPNKKKNNARHCYLLVKKSVNCFQDIVHQYTRDASAKFKHRLHIMPGQMVFHNEDYQCIRINTRDVDFMPELIVDLNALGIEFLSDRKTKKYQSLIYFKKYIEFVKLGEGFYQDANLPSRYYFSIQKTVEYSEFEAKMSEIKNSCGFHLFDSYMGHFFRKDSVQNFVVIYSEHCDESKFTELEKQLIEKFS